MTAVASQLAFLPPGWESSLSPTRSPPLPVVPDATVIFLNHVYEYVCTPSGTSLRTLPLSTLNIAEASQRGTLDPSGPGLSLSL